MGGIIPDSGSFMGKSVKKYRKLLGKSVKHYRNPLSR